jgi:hypothetical protein
MTLSRTSKRFSRLWLLLLTLASVNVIAQQAPLPVASLPVASNTAVLDPQTGDTWIATWGSGLVRYSAGRFDIFDQFNSGVASDLVFDVAVLDGRIFSATIGGVSVFEPVAERWSLYFARHVEAQPDVWVDLDVHDGGLFATSSRGSVRRYEAEHKRWSDAGLSDPPRRPVASPRTSDVPYDALAIYGPRNRTIQLPGSPSRQAGDPARSDLVAVGNATTASFKLLSVSGSYAGYGWALPEDDVAYFARNPRVGGIVGHLAPQAQPILNDVIAWSGIGFVTTAPLTDPEQAAVFANPFAFRCYGAEQQRHRMLFDHLTSSEDVGLVAIIQSGSAHDDLRPGWWLAHAARRGVKVVTVESHSSFAGLRPDVVMTWQDAEATVGLVQRLREAGVDCPIVVSSACLRDDQMLLAPTPLGTLITIDVGGNAEERNVTDSYNGADHLSHAVAQANTSRSSVESVLRTMRDSGQGETHFEQKHSSPNVSVARLEDGRWVRFTIRAE